MERYDLKRMELSTRDVVARAIYTEVREGRGTENGGAFLDISHKPAEYVKRKLPSMYHQFLELADVDIAKGPMEVGPTCHYMMGGVRVEAETAASNVPGLFAAGEVATGLHGANRLGGNSLSDLLVFGRRAGLSAAQFAQRAAAPSLDAAQIEKAEREMLGFFERADGEGPYALHADLQQSMQTLVGIFRAEADLTSALDAIARLQERWQCLGTRGTRMFNPGWHLCTDLKSLLMVSEAVTRSALARKESRGAHSRLDYPQLDAAWGTQNTVVSLRGSKMVLEQRPIPKMSEESQALLGEEKGAGA